MNFKGCCLMKNNVPIPKKVTNLCIYYALDPRLRNLNRSFSLGICLFGSVMLPKTVVTDKDNYNSYSIGFHSRSEFITWRYHGENVIIFGADMSSYVHVDNKGKDILTLGERKIQGLNDTTLTAEAKYLINIT